MSGQKFIQSSQQHETRGEGGVETAPIFKEITDPYRRWKYWEILQNNSRQVAAVFAQVLFECPEITFAVTTNGRDTDFSLVDEERHPVAHALYSDLRKAWIAAGNEVNPVGLSRKDEPVGTLAETQVCDALVASVTRQKLVEQKVATRMGLVLPLSLRLVRHPDAFGGVEKYGCGKCTPPLFPWLTCVSGGVMSWRDVERTRTEARKPLNQIRRVWDAFICAAAGVPKGSTYE